MWPKAEYKVILIKHIDGVRGYSASIFLKEWVMFSKKKMSEIQKTNEIILHATTWRNPESITLREKSQTKKEGRSGTLWIQNRHRERRAVFRGDRSGKKRAL